MKTNISLTLIFLLGILSSCDSQSEKTEKKDTINEPFWTFEKAKKHALEYNSSEKWETKSLEMEVESLNEFPRPDFPLYDSPFPTPRYSTPGNGIGLAPDCDSRTRDNTRPSPPAFR